jgi:enoyl-CoA hydratase/carnithine racemase
MRTVDAEEALAIGLVDRIVEDPLDSALDYAAALLSLDHSALSAVKKVISIDSVDESPRAERAANSSWDGEVRRP